jgi:hypothetical protein
VLSVGPIVADEAFPLKSYIMKPFSRKTTNGIEKRTFSYRLSRARRVVENSFGILANCFRVFLSPILLRPKKVELLVSTCCVLHNFILVKILRNTVTCLMTCLKATFFQNRFFFILFS